MRSKATGFPFLATLMFSFVTVGACAASRPVAVVALPNGYYMQANKEAQASIVKRSGGKVLPGPIAAYSVYRHIVLGALGVPSALSRSYTNDLPFRGVADTRYFVLDTSSGKLETGLTEADWKQRLEQLGAPASLEIYAPVIAQ
jgi:hypothetical protein